jgi:hypothetical protein
MVRLVQMPVQERNFVNEAVDPILPCVNDDAMGAVMRLVRGKDVKSRGILT